MSAQPYPSGMDYVWLASDKDEHVAAFVTGGSGPVATSVLESAIPIDEIEARLLTIDRMTKASVHTDAPKPDSYVELAERGLFVLDWEEAHRPLSRGRLAYMPAATPLVPLNLRALPQDLREIGEVTVIPRVKFSSVEPIDVAALLPCTD